MKQDLLSMVVYGSVARGKAHPESDIDLLILYRKGNFDTDEAYAVPVIESRESREYRVLFEKDMTEKLLIISEILAKEGLLLFMVKRFIQKKMQIMPKMGQKIFLNG